jgi:DNA-binding NarL/FixJ family response regulator
VAQGDYFTSPLLTNTILQNTHSPENRIERRLNLHLLTSMERRVLYLIANDKSTRDIAQELSISPKTVVSHRNNISTKLHLRGSFFLLRFALEHKALL